MKLLLIFLGFFFYLTLSGQSCLLPQSMDELRPDRCAIRHISENELGVKVILEFEKEGRVLASHVPNKQTNGIRTTLRGIFELQFDHKGALVAEQKRYLQTGTLPADCHVFGLGDQQYQKLEARLTFISEEDYKNLPWLDVQGEKKSQKSLDNRIRFETTVETDPQTGQLSAIHLLKYQELENEEVEVIEQKATNLMEYDSATKKTYWMPLIEAFSNAVSGTSHLLMGRKDKKLDKFAPSRLLRFATFDSLGTEINHHDLVFDYPMELVHVFANNSDLSIGLQHVILMFRHLEVEAEINPKVDRHALHFFVFDSSGKLLSNGVAKHDEPMALFQPIHYDWLENGITWWHQHEDKISVSHLTYTGQYIVRDALAGVPNLEALIQQRSNRHKPITLQLQHNPLQTSAGHWFYTFKVQEDISIGHQNDNYRGRATHFLTHGVLLYSLDNHGQSMASVYYQRPKDAAPQASIDPGKISHNNFGISFYFTETTSSGTHPILVNVDEKIHVIDANEARPVSRQIYYDPSVPLAAFFAKVPDQRNPGQYFSTIEVLRIEEALIDMSGLEPAFRK